jgi:hypothetical protein
MTDNIKKTPMNTHCVNLGCQNQGYWGWELYPLCFDHIRPGNRIIVKKCIGTDSNCSNQAIYSLAPKTEPLACESHKKPDMVLHHGVKKCNFHRKDGIICQALGIYLWNREGYKTTMLCSTHYYRMCVKVKGVKEFYGAPRCYRANCNENAAWGFLKTTNACDEHALLGMTRNFEVCFACQKPARQRIARALFVCDDCGNSDEFTHCYRLCTHKGCNSLATASFMQYNRPLICYDHRRRANDRVKRYTYNPRVNYYWKEDGEKPKNKNQRKPKEMDVEELEPPEIDVEELEINPIVEEVFPPAAQVFQQAAQVFQQAAQVFQQIPLRDALAQNPLGQNPLAQNPVGRVVPPPTINIILPAALPLINWNLSNPDEEYETIMGLD